MIKVDLNIRDLLAIGQNMDPALRKALKDAGDRLTAMTRAHIAEEAQQKLHTRRQMFLEGLHHERIDDTTWVVTLDAKVRWIDDGQEPHSMLDDLLKSKKAKRAKDGSKYLVVPFKHNKGPTQTTPAQKNLLATIKTELEKKNIPYGGIEMGPDGKAKLGLIHKLDITHAPPKTHHGVGQGHGPIGQPIQGPTGIPFLKGIRIYQHPIPTSKLGSTEASGFEKHIMTFRVASSKHQGQGRWMHPGSHAMNLMEDGAEWALKTWEKEVLPKLMEQVKAGL